MKEERGIFLELRGRLLERIFGRVFELVADGEARGKTPWREQGEKKLLQRGRERAFVGGFLRRRSFLRA